jgi:hypothetical protein
VTVARLLLPADAIIPQRLFSHFRCSFSTTVFIYFTFLTVLGVPALASVSVSVTVARLLLPADAVIPQRLMGRALLNPKKLRQA